MSVFIDCLEPMKTLKNQKNFSNFEYNGWYRLYHFYIKCALINLYINTSTKTNKKKPKHINKQWMLLQKGFSLIVLPYLLCCIARPLDTIQDFSSKLGMKPGVHLLEISIFSLCHVVVRPTKIIKDLLKDHIFLIDTHMVSCPNGTKNIKWYLTSPYISLLSENHKNLINNRQKR